MVTIEYRGRLANNIIQLLAGYFFARKHGLAFDPDLSRIDMEAGTDCRSLIRADALPLEGGQYGGNPVLVDDGNFMGLYAAKALPRARYHLAGYFQRRDFLESVRPMIDEVLRLDYRPGHEDDVFVHYRIGDLLLYQRGAERVYTPRQFFNEALKSIDYRRGYISTDSPHHPDYLYLVRKFGLEEVRVPPLETILFGKDFGNLVLSEYSFSGLIGYLSRAGRIHCNRRSLWTLGEGTMLNGFDHYRLGRWSYRGGHPVNEAHAEMNSLHGVVSGESPHLERIRQLAFDCETVCEVSGGTGRETLAILSGYPESLHCLYLRPPIESGTDPAYLSDRAAETQTRVTVGVAPVPGKLPAEVDMLVCTCGSVVGWGELLDLMQRVRKHIVLHAGTAAQEDLGYLAALGMDPGQTNLPERLSTMGFELVERDSHWFFSRRP